MAYRATTAIKHHLLQIEELPNISSMPPSLIATQSIASQKSATTQSEQQYRVAVWHFVSFQIVHRIYSISHGKFYVFVYQLLNIVNNTLQITISNINSNNNSAFSIVSRNLCSTF